MRHKLLILAALLLTAPVIQAQDQPAGSAASAEAVTEPFQVTIILKITDHGKLTTDQTFTLAAASEGNPRFNSPSVRDGDRVPISTDKNGNSWQYTEIGTNIDVQHLRKIGSLIGMQLQIVNSGAIASPTGQTLPPVLRSLNYSLTPVIPVGKSILIYSSGDGINSQKVEIQVQVQPLAAK